MTENLQRKKYLVAGANSFLAREIIERLMRQNDVTCIYHDNTQNLFHDLKSVHVSEVGKLEDEFDVVFIISAFIPPRGKPVDEKLLTEVNIHLPEKICRQFKSAKVVFASSVSVYGETPGVLNEVSSSVHPSLYGSSKKAGEQVVGAHHKYSILRISSMYGIGMNRSTFIPMIIEAALKEKRITLNGVGSRMQNYIHVSDVAEFFIRAAERTENGIYLSAGEKSISNNEIAGEIKKLLDHEVSISYTGEDDSPSFHYSADLTYQSLHYRPKITIHEGISSIIQWQKKMFL